MLLGKEHGVGYKYFAEMPFSLLKKYIDFENDQILAKKEAMQQQNV